MQNATHLPIMPTLAKWPIFDLKKGLTVYQVAEKHGWPESMDWSIALDGKNDLGRFSDLQWELRTWDKPEDRYVFIFTFNP